MTLGRLPGLQEAFRAPLARLNGFGFLVCSVPSRRAAKDAISVLKGLLSEAGRASARFAPTSPVARERVLIAVVDQDGVAERERLLVGMNVARDAIAAVDSVLLAVVLDDDLPRLADIAPDLWSVRTAVARYDRLVPAAPLRTARSLGGDHPVPPELREICDAFSLRGLHTGGEGERRFPRPRIGDVYQPIEAAGPAPGGRILAGEATELLTRYPCCLLVGAAGSGKSTVLRRLALRLTRAGQAVVLVSLARLDLDRLRLDDLRAALQALCGECDWKPDPDARPWLLLDGLDELPGVELRVRLVLTADDLVFRGLASGATVSTRPEAVGHPALRQPGESEPSPSALRDLPELMLRELSDSMLRRYFGDWVKVACERSERPEHLERLLTMVGLAGVPGPRSRRLLQLCRRPLFVAAVSALVWSRGAALGGEDEVLDAFVEALIHRRKERRAAGLSPDDLRSLAADVAWQLDLSGAFVAPAAELIERSSLLDGESLDALRVGTGLLVDEQESVAFVHAALQEALAGAAALDRLDLADVAKFVQYLWRGANPEVSPAGRYLVERMGRLMPGKLLRLLEVEELQGAPDGEVMTGARLVDLSFKTRKVAELLADIWGGEPPLRLRSLSGRLRELHHRLNRDPLNEPDVAPVFPWLLSWVRALSAILAHRLGDRRIGRLDFAPVGGGWELARWPVTTRLFAEFMQDGGYEESRHWSKPGWAWRRRPARSRRKDAPEGWGVEGRAEPWLPVTGLSHHEALAFVRWYAATRDPRCCLPGRAQWEAAASASLDGRSRWRAGSGTSSRLWVQPWTRPASRGSRTWAAWSGSGWTLDRRALSSTPALPSAIRHSPSRTP